MSRDSPPWTTTQLRGWLETLGTEHLLRRLGQFALVGSVALGDSVDSSWSFTTDVRAPSGARPAARIDLAEAAVYPVLKRSSTFFPTTILVGRASSNDVVLDHPSVSKLHARLRLTDHGFWVEDAGSQNGSSLDGEPITEPVVAEPGDQLQFGDLAFLVLDSRTLAGQLGTPP